MKIKSILGMSLLAMCGMALMATSARAATTGDLILGFEELSGTATSTDVEVDLGSYSSPVSTINVNSILTAAYGAGWATSGEIAWSVEGTTYTNGSSLSPQVTLTGTQNTSNTSYNNIIWVSVPTTSAYVPPKSSSSTQGSAAGLIYSEYTTYGAGTAGSNVTFNPNNNVGDYSYAENANGNYTSPYGGNLFTSTNIEGVGPSSANLYQMIGGASLHADPSVTDIGTFTLDSSGNFSYTAIPEPSTYIMLGLGGFGLLVFSRRRLARLGLVG